MAEYTLDVLQLHAAPHYERVLDGEDELTPNKLLGPNLGEPQEVVRLRDGPEHAVLLWQKPERDIGRDGCEHLCKPHFSSRVD